MHGTIKASSFDKQYALERMPLIAKKFDALCAAIEKKELASCQLLKDTMVTLVYGKKVRSVNLAWQKLIESSNEDAFRDLMNTNKDNVSDYDMRLFAKNMRELLQFKLDAIYAIPFQKLIDSQKGGVLLDISGELRDRYSSRLKQLASDVSFYKENANWLTQWEAYEQVASSTVGLEFDEMGMLTSVGQNSQGETILTIDTKRTEQEYYKGATRFILFIISLALFIIFTVLAFRYYDNAQKRKEALRVYTVEKLSQTLICGRKKRRDLCFKNFPAKVYAI